MKILHLTPWFPHHRHDQSGNFILDSVEALAELGHEGRWRREKESREAFM